MPGQSLCRFSPDERAACWFAVGALVTGVVLAVLFCRRESSTPVEAQRGELTLRDGRWFRGGGHKPFTGVMVERYENGELRSRGELSNGLLHGLSQGWYTNGQRQTEEHFRAGVSDGLRTKWHANGQKSSEAKIVNGRMEGLFRRWDEAGMLAEATEMRDGNPEGLSRGYYPSGFVKAEARGLNVVSYASRDSGKMANSKSRHLCRQPSR